MPETDKMLGISQYFGVTMDSLLKDEDILTGNKDATDDKQPSESASQSIPLAGLVVCAFGLVGLLVWGLITILQPQAAEQISDSSMITINGAGILLFICLATLVVGAVLLLKKRK